MRMLGIFSDRYRSHLLLGCPMQQRYRLGWSPQHGAVHLAQFRVVANSAHLAE